MWDTPSDTGSYAITHLSHDRPCTQCGHAIHTYLRCSDTCDCVPTWLNHSHAA